ncbi:signal peptidase II [Spiroplasma taiwanense]|uniref:Lipoprotein signal peptidase n=1 Tax=Spiroplasma taiwanense CT-1 TaxID=1276220 RepID=S5M0C2_9MOLU|nr:signal peptidase II [Spiroplasma taiwanense]AGR41442.1 lipoprotein signal peptidase [Spiroplasma taiwanense CT-1]
MKEFFFNLKGTLKNYNYILKYKLVWCLPIILFLLFLDWLSKGIVTSTMNLGDDKEFISGLINFEYTINPGAAYGINADLPTLAISIAIFVSLFIIVAFIFVKDKWWILGINFMLAGSLGNLIARIWAPPTENGIYGGVVDFLKFDFSFLGSDSYIFNLADAWVTISVILIIIALIIYLYCEIYELKLKKNEKLFEIYNDVQSQKLLTFEIYWSTFYKKDSENKISYKEYIQKMKSFNMKWKNEKKENN